MGRENEKEGWGERSKANYGAELQNEKGRVLKLEMRVGPTVL